MAFGVTNSGYILKRLEDIQDETTDAFQAAFGAGIDLDPRTIAGQLKAIFDERIALLHELQEGVYYSQYPFTAEGINLDNVVALNGLTRKQETKSRVETGVAHGDFGTVIPAGTVISVLGNSAARFVTDNPYTINIAAINEVQNLDFGAVPDAGQFTINFDGQITAAILFSAVAADIKTALENLSNVDTVNVTGDFTSGFEIEFTGALAGLPLDELTIETNTLEESSNPVAITVSTSIEGEKAKAINIILDAETAGPFAAPAGSLSVIETPVAGLDEFTNILDAELGSDTETDAELKARREQQLQVAGKATPEAIRSNVLAINDVEAVRVFFNNMFITDIEGRPPKSVDVVVEGGDEQDIADELFDTVAAGILTIGDITKQVIDSQGFTHDIKFSRPDEILVWLEIDLTTDSSFPVDGLQQVEDEILAYAETLGISDDVIVYPKLMCSFAHVPGITDVAIRIGTAISPTLDDNIIIADREIAKFDSSRIAVIEI